MAAPIAVYLEIGAKRTFAGAIEWPGWCRIGKSEDEALDALLAYAPRYAPVVQAAGLALGHVSDLGIVERLPGGSGTDFGAPSVAPEADQRPLTQAELDRQSRLLVASWQAFDIAWSEVAEAGGELRKGPRGGGRDLPKMQLHILDAEEAYLTRLGSRVPHGAATVAERTSAVRDAALAAMAARARGESIADPSAVERRWEPRYFVRRSAWHALDHAWEIEDRERP